MNKLIILGRLTDEISIKEGANASYTNFSIAYSKGDKEKNNTLFLDCVAFNEVARNLQLYTHKGARILLEGTLIQDTWVDKMSGEKKSKMKVQVRNFYKIDYKQDNTNTQGNKNIRANTTNAQRKQRIEINLNDNLPF